LPDKYGGLPMYTRNQTEYSDFVSRYTAPLSTALQNDTVLLGRQGYSVTNESASHPYRDVGFEHNLHKSKDAIDYNEAKIKQRQWLQYQSQVARKQKQGGKITEMRMSSKNGRGIKNAVDGIFISANGEPMTQVNSESLGDLAYEATIDTPPPTFDNFLPGPGRQQDPSSDELVEYNPFIDDSSRVIADEVMGLNRSSQLRRLSPEDSNTLLGGFAAFRNARPPSNSVEGIAFSRILNTARRVLFPRTPGIINQEIVIDANPLQSQASVLSSASYIPGGSQPMSLLESIEGMSRRLNNIRAKVQVISGQGSLPEPDQIIASPPYQFSRRNRRRESLSGGASSEPRQIIASPPSQFSRRNRRRESLSGEGLSARTRAAVQAFSASPSGKMARVQQRIRRERTF